MTLIEMENIICVLFSEYVYTKKLKKIYEEPYKNYFILFQITYS